MVEHNPDIDPDDHTSLLRNACTINGANCLEVYTAGLDKAISKTEFVFKVDFVNSDGEIFSLGPCCGSNEPDFQFQIVFNFRVVKDENAEHGFLVMDMPPYSP